MITDMDDMAKVINQHVAVVAIFDLEYVADNAVSSHASEEISSSLFFLLFSSSADTCVSNDYYILLGIRLCLDFRAWKQSS